MTHSKVMVMSPIFPAALANLDAQFDLVRCDQAEDRETFMRSNGKNCRAVILNGHVRLGTDELEYLPDLELVACTSAGFEAIDVAALKRSGIAMTNTSQALRDDVADAAVMLMLATRRNLLSCDAYVRTGQWGTAGPYPRGVETQGEARRHTRVWGNWARNRSTAFAHEARNWVVCAAPKRCRVPLFFRRRNVSQLVRYPFCDYPRRERNVSFGGA